ncbi:MAG: hypothetical protein QOD12_819 [Verrucomicrobiota bacterium]
MKFRRTVIIYSALSALSMGSPAESLAQKPEATPTASAADIKPDGLTEDFIKATFSAVWQHDVTSIQIGAPVKLKEATRIFQVHRDTLMFPVRAQDAAGWRHATYFYQDDYLHWHSTLDLVLIE